MSSLDESLADAIARGVHRIGQIEILRDFAGAPFALCHADDLPRLNRPAGHGLDVRHGPDTARELSTWAADGSYRFTKAQLNLRHGWLLLLDGIQALRQALDAFYPAAVGLWAAGRQDRLRIQNLRDKLDRQTGMYRYARTISDAGAQALVRQTCGPANQCVKRILWRIQADVPLEDSEASRFPGVLAGVPEAEAIPLLCQEACNHFVAECRRVAKEEHSPA